MSGIVSQAYLDHQLRQRCAFYTPQVCEGRPIVLHFTDGPVKSALASLTVCDLHAGAAAGKRTPYCWGEIWPLPHGLLQTETARAWLAFTLGADEETRHQVFADVEAWARAQAHPHARQG